MLIAAGMSLFALALVLLVVLLALRSRYSPQGATIRDGELEGWRSALERPGAGPDDEVRVMQVARRIAEQKAWTLAREIAERRIEAARERHLMDVARALAERRAWQVAIEIASQRARADATPA